LLRRLTFHLLAVNEVAHLKSDSARTAYVMEAYNKAYAAHVLISAMAGWHLRGPAGSFRPGVAKDVVQAFRLAAVS
jgi:hypothetical protein